MNGLQNMTEVLRRYDIRSTTVHGGDFQNHIIEDEISRTVDIFRLR